MPSLCAASRWLSEGVPASWLTLHRCGPQQPIFLWRPGAPLDGGPNAQPVAPRRHRASVAASELATSLSVRFPNRRSSRGVKARGARLHAPNSAAGDFRPRPATGQTALPSSRVACGFRGSFMLWASRRSSSAVQSTPRPLWQCDFGSGGSAAAGQLVIPACGVIVCSVVGCVWKRSAS